VKKAQINGKDIVIKIKIKDKFDIKRQYKELPSKIQNLKYDIGSTIAKFTLDEVKKHIPFSGEWYQIYRNALKFYYDGKEWAVAGYADVNIKDVDAKITLVRFGKGDDGSAILAEYNPWPIDMIPPTAKGYTSVINLYPASTSEVESNRKRLLAIYDNIKIRLGKAGYSVREGDLPILAGKKTVDLKYLSQRLEYGLGPFRHSPHWSKTVSKMSTIMREVTASSAGRFYSVLRGNFYYKPLSMPSKVRSMINSSRKINLNAL